jgi:hypothetical protein
MKQSLAYCCLLPLWLSLNSEDEGDMFFCNLSWLSINYMVLYPRRQNSSIMALISAGNPSILWGLSSPTRSNRQGLKLGKYGAYDHLIKTAVQSGLILLMNQNIWRACSAQHFQCEGMCHLPGKMFGPYLLNTQLLSYIIMKQIGISWYCSLHQNTALEIVKKISEDPL